MPKFKITYGCRSYGKDEEIIEADSQDKAMEIAYEAAMDLISGELIYSAEPVEEDEES